MQFVFTFSLMHLRKMRNSVPDIGMHILTKLPIISYPRRFSIQMTNPQPEKKYLQTPRDSFHRAIFPTLFVAQVFGLFPVQGISANHCAHLRFKWKSFRTLYSGVLLSFCLFMLSAEIYRTHKSDTEDPNYANVKSLSK